MSGICSLSFTQPEPRDRTGNIVSSGSDIPTMRPRARATDAQLSKLLAAALEALADTPCSFWACDGPRKPKYMCTCGKCWAMRDIATVMATLEAR